MSVYGVDSGRMSSLTATRKVEVTGGCKRSVSRTTESRYGRALSSSMEGLSLETVCNSDRSFFWTSGQPQRAYRAQVVAVLVVSWPATRNVGTSEKQRGQRETYVRDGVRTGQNLFVRHSLVFWQVCCHICPQEQGQKILSPNGFRSVPLSALSHRRLAPFEQFLSYAIHGPLSGLGLGV